MLGCRFGIFASSKLPSTAALAPDQITNLQLWVDGQDNNTIKNASDTNAVNNDPVATWQDKSGNNRHLTQSTSNARPLYKTTGINNFASILFDGSDDKLGNIYTIGSQYLTIISVHKGGSNGVLWTMAAATGGENFYPNYGGTLYLANSSGNWFAIFGLDNAKAWISVARYRQTPSNTTLLRVCSTVNGITNNINEAPFTPNFAFNGGFAIGGHVAEYFNALVGEMIIYNRALTDAEIAGLFAYLRAKWNI